MLTTESVGQRLPVGADLSNKVEFLPTSVRQQRLRRHRLVRQGYLLAACIVVMGVLTYVRQGRIAHARGNLVELERCRSNLQRQVAMIAPLERQMADLLIKKRIDEELGSRTDCTAVLAELCWLTPSNVSMISLELKTVELRLESRGGSGPSSLRLGSRRGFPVRGASIRGARPVAAAGGYRSRIPVHADLSAGAINTVRRVRMMVTGLAPTDVDVANFIGQLSASPLFEDVSMGYTKTVVFRERSAREFQASCYLVR